MQRNAFFYNNPAQRRVARPAAANDGRQQRAEAPGTRPEWFECACCPPNIMRTVASLGAFVATHDPTGLQLHHFLPASLTVPVGAGMVALSVRTGYPTNGAVRITVDEASEGDWTLALRRPGWCRQFDLTVNGDPVDVSANARGYLEITRRWRAGDVVAYTMAMPLRLTVAHPAVDAVHGMAAIERGPDRVLLRERRPAVHCGPRTGWSSTSTRALTEEVRDDLPGGPAVVARVPAVARDDSQWSRTGWATLGDEPDRHDTDVVLTAIPYHLWANRGPSVMRIFTPIRPGSR